MAKILDVEQALLLLELDPPFAKRDVQLARRRQAKVWHPDLAPPGKRVAHERHLKAINEAADERTPLLERMKFLSIVSSNIDEFFEIRIAGLKEEIAANSPPGPDGIALREVFRLVSERAQDLVARQYQVLNESVLPQLAAEGIRIVRRNKWNAGHKEWVKDYFFRELMPVLGRSA